MGEEATEAVELSCPGCGGYIKLEPSGGSIPQGIVPCPMCMVDVPVPASVVARYVSEGGDEAQPPFLTPSDSKMPPVHGEAVAPQGTFSKESSAAIAESEQMSVDLPAGATGVVNSTFEGRPEDNASKRNGDQDKPASVPVSDLDRLDLEEREARSDEEYGSSKPDSEISDPTSSGALLPEIPTSEAGAKRPSLASLFRKVRAKYIEGKKRRDEDLNAFRDTSEHYAAAKVLAETSRDASEELSKNEVGPILASSEDLLAESSAPILDDLSSGLPRPSDPALSDKALSAPSMPTVSNTPGRPTSDSILARLQQQPEQASESANLPATSGRGTSDEDVRLTEELDALFDSLGKQPSPASPPVLSKVAAEPSDPVVAPKTVAAPAPAIKSKPEPASKGDTSLTEDDLWPAPGEKRKGIVLAGLAVAVAVVVTVAIAVASGVYFSGAYSPSPWSWTAAPSLPKENASAQDVPSGSQVSAAMEQVEKALPLVLADQDQPSDGAGQQLTSGNAREAARLLGDLWSEGAKDALFDPYTEALLAARDYRRLRVVAIEAMRSPALEQKARAMFARSLVEDQDLRQNEPIGIGKDPGLRILGLETVAGVDQLMIESGSKRFIFKPAQPTFENGWRIEVATYRLCEAILCHFRIPQTRPARLERAGFDAQAAQWASGGRERLQAAKWSWKSAEGVESVDGSLQEVIAHDAVWPIEDLPLWHDWLSVTSNAKVLEQPLGDNIDRVRQRSGQEPYARLLAASEGSSTGDISQQVADILTFDFLTNNWERFQTNPERFGTSTPIVAGQVLSIHNGEAFQPRASRRVQGRFEWTSRYSRTMVEAIRALEPEFVNDLLFPAPSAVDRVRLNVFWSQRRRMLERVDSLIARHGEDKVLFFDSSR